MPNLLTIPEFVDYDTRLDALEAAGPATSPLPNTVLRIPADHGHISTGPFYKLSQPYTTFFSDCLVRCTGQSTVGYIVSSGYGGAHNLLYGFEATGTHYRITGNIWNGTATVSFSTDQVFKIGDWVHITHLWDLTQLLVYVNGVCEGRTAYAASDRSVSGIGDANLFIGGSNHSKIDLDIAWFRLWEDQLPLDLGLRFPYRPQMWPQATFYDGTDFIQCNLLYDFTVPARIINDLSIGLDGVRHSGIAEGLLGPTGAFNDPNLLNSPDNQKPYWVDADFSEPAHDTEAAPAGALIWDGFNRHESHFWRDVPSLGSTEGGSLGPKVWTSGTSYGCSYSRAYPVYTSDVITRVDTEGTDRSVRYTLVGGIGDFYARYTDANNYVVVHVSMGNHSVVKRIAGVDTSLYSTVVGATATSVKIDCLGDDITVYINDANVFSTNTALPAGEDTGFSVLAQNLAKVGSIEVQALV